MNGVTLVRAGVSLLASAGTSKVVNDVITNNVNVVTTTDAIRVWAGKVVIGMIAIDFVSDRINAKWDAAAKAMHGKEVKVTVHREGEAEAETST
jgi:hypothetical protein